MRTGARQAGQSRGRGQGAPAGRRAFAGAGLLAAFVLAAACGPAKAQESAAVTSPRAGVTLVADAAQVVPGQQVRIGLRQKLAPGWHTYWTNPGDAGTPPEIALTLPEGANAGEIAWPGPDRFAVGPVMSFGYAREVVFPIAVTVPGRLRPGDTFTVEADASWLVCEKECIPEAGRFTLALPVAAQAAPPAPGIAAAFAATDARRPIILDWRARLAAEGGSITLTVEGDGITPERIADAFFYPQAWGVITHAAPQALEVTPGRLTLVAEKGQTFDPTAAHGGLIAVTDPAGATRWIEVAPAAASAAARPAGFADPAGAAAERLPLARAILFAFLGGLILNLMPCVFPVLAIKATALARLSGQDLKAVRLSGMFYTVGVLAAFLALAGALLAMRAAGAAVGWGFQFQSPVFVAATAWLMLAIGLNLSGVFEVGTSLTGAGHHLAHAPSHKGSFFTGLLAVVVATPCTAPFMGAAIGSALAAPVPVALCVFAAMGLGLAAPYALIAFAPRLARLLPRPGLWMVRLRQGLAFPMYATAAWLVWVLTRQAGELGVMIALAGGVLVALAAWIYGVAQHGRGRGLVPRALALAAVAGTIALLPQLRAAAAPGAAPEATAGTERFSAARLADLRREGRPVFVNMTAAWCITCLVNERTALSTGAAKAAFRDKGVVYLKGDWTNQDPEITAFLRAFGRDGLPFYALYPKGGGDPVVLPPVLTEARLVEALSRAAH
ncbi:protein-disulfide reductase DsbD domain-containing protein [Xanthobacter sp. KR7-225]|uniref:protein-disulfide reductase DsbD family protein n=1 Tax=Xanthobacter sp. KR7-225 TaxID=3156613 RepID=UPI0032B5764C